MFRKTVLVRALTLAFSTAALTAAVTQPAMAQSNAAGTIYGKVPAGSATTVTLRNTDTNQTRTSAVDGAGSFSVSNLAIGHYKATLNGGTMNGQIAEVDVIAGQGVEAVFASTVQSVQISGRRSRIDVANATNGATFTAKELNKLPIAHNVDAIIQLSPNTTRSDPTYPAGASIGGGGASENSYYINGFPVTNPLTQLGASQLPFGAIAQAEIKTGGYGAEFGRSVGGVINITGKSGSNNWEAGLLLSDAPNSWRAKSKDIFYPVIGASNTTATDGTLRLRNSQNQLKQTETGGYVGGPIIKDKLFMFLSVQENQTDEGFVNQTRTVSAGNSSSGWVGRTTKTLRTYGKIDWNITDEHRLEFTGVGDDPRRNSSTYQYNYATGVIGTNATSSIFTDNNLANGGYFKALHYTGNITDNFTVSALYGKSNSVHIYEPAGYNPNLFSTTTSAAVQAPGLNYTSPQTFSGAVPLSGASDKVTASRIDLEYKISDHTIRGGIDNLKMSSLNAGNVSAGGGNWQYLFTPTPKVAIPVPGGTVPAIAGAGGLAAQGFYVVKNLSSTASNAYAGQSAQYLEDQYKVTRNLLITVGIRDEQFYNANQDNTRYIDQKNNVMPRFSAVWDANGDSTFKVFGSAGRYSVPMPTVVALRGANGSLNTSTYYTYTGTDANGLPTGLGQLTGALSANNEYGQAKDPKTLAATGMKPSNQDELTLGFEKQFSPDLNFGAKVTYRTLKSTIDDFCDQRPFDKYAAAHNIKEAPTYSFNCASFNPGEDNDFLVDYSDTRSNYTLVHLSAADLGFEKAKRTYTAIDLFLEHPYRNGWYGKFNYTWSRDTGNTEGQTLSDLNTGQSDVAATTTWDYKELMVGANGLLPNDRTHQFKAYGFYDLTSQFTIGGFFTLESGRPNGCVGQAPNPGDSPNYGVEHYCFGATGATNVLVPRGSIGRMPWTKELDLNLVYKPGFLKDLNVKLDIFNVFNSQIGNKRFEQFNSGAARSSTYGAFESYTAARSMKITAEYNHKF